MIEASWRSEPPGDDSARHQDLAPVPLCFADSLLTGPGPRLLTVREVAAHLRVSTRTVYSLCETGGLAHVRVRNAIRIPPAALIALLGPRTT